MPDPFAGMSWNDLYGGHLDPTDVVGVRIVVKLRLAPREFGYQSFLLNVRADQDIESSVLDAVGRMAARFARGYRGSESGEIVEWDVTQITEGGFNKPAVRLTGP